MVFEQPAEPARLRDGEPARFSARAARDVGDRARLGLSEACGGKLRPGVVLFGEMLPREDFEGAEAAARAADLFVVLGSSLLVSPANYFPQIAKAAGARLVIVNHDPTPLDEQADMVVRGSIRDTLCAIAPLLRSGPTDA